MAISLYPNGLDTFTEKVDGVDDVLAYDFNKLQEAIAAIEARIGILGSNVPGTIDYVLQSAGVGATGGNTATGKEAVFYLNQTSINESFSIPANYNSGTFGPITISEGVTITIPDGSTWTIV